MSDRFAACLAVLLGQEGGYSNRPLRADPGGKTMRGVTHATYDAWRRSQGLPTRDVRQMEEREWVAIYRENYWDAVRADALPPGLDLCAFDFGVNSGPGTAIKHLQRVLRVPADGHLGAITLNAVAANGNHAATIAKYIDARRIFGRALRNYPDNPGWETRWTHIERVALVMSGEGDVEPPPPPLPDASAQAAATGKAVASDPKPPVTTEVTLGIGGILSNVGGVANGFAKVAAMKEPTWSSVALAFLSEPLVLTGLIMVFSAALTCLWRRRFAQ